MEQEFLALQWAIAGQFQEYLLWKLFFVRTNNNPLTYIMTTPNLDATQHWWVESLAKFTFRRDNAATAALSQVTLKAGSRNHEVHPGWSHCGNNQKS